MGADTPRDRFPRRKRLIALTQPARNVRAKCSMKLELWRADRDICRALACSECAPSHCDYRNSKVQRLRLNRHGLSWASRPQEAIVGESNIGGPSGRKRAGVGSAVAVPEQPTKFELSINLETGQRSKSQANNCAASVVVVDRFSSIPQHKTAALRLRASRT
jgi:hypothetical protein